MNKEYIYDIYRYYGKYKETIVQKLFRPQGLKYTILLRKCNTTKNKLLKNYYKYRLFLMQRNKFIQIPYNVNIGRGFYIGHYGRIIINPNVKIGNNCNIHTGVTIGQENRGIREGSPTIGNEVWIGTNSVIVGKIQIGNDVLIAPNSYVNFDIPDHSIVIGNPGRIIEKQKATEGYINRKVNNNENNAEFK